MKLFPILQTFKDLNFEKSLIITLINLTKIPMRFSYEPVSSGCKTPLKLRGPNIS